MFIESPVFVIVFSLMFKRVLDKPQLKNLRLFLTQRIITSPKHMTIAKIRNIFFHPPSLNALDNFLNTSTDLWSRLKNRRKEIIFQRFFSRKGALIIDDTFCYKTGKMMQGIFKNFCHVLGKKVLSHVVVTSVYTTPKISISYDFKVYIPKDIAKNFKTKYELALEMIKDAYMRGLIKRIYIDSWYCQPALLSKLKPMALEFFGQFRIGRMKIKNDGVYVSLKQLVNTVIENNFFTYRRIRGRKKTMKLRVFSKIVFVKHVGKVRLVVSQKYDQKRKEYNEPRVYVTNVLSMRALDIIRTYLKRWDIEVFHKTAKQSYGFEDYQVINAQARDGYFELAFLSDMLLQLKRLGQLRLQGASGLPLCHVSTEKKGSESLVLDALTAQKKGTLKEFIEYCGFNTERFKYHL